MPLVPSADSILREALVTAPSLNINELHEKAYRLMILHRSKYYERRVNEILSTLNLPKYDLEKVKEKLLEPITVGEITYSNFMEEVSRRISQSFQPISGQLAELCAQRELERAGLREGVNFTHREERTDFTIYYPQVQRFSLKNYASANFQAKPTKKHRIEVKNVSLRERATRGLAFDGDSLLGFFNQPNEFTESNVRVLENLCIKTGGYCYVPPKILEEIPYKTTRFKSNTQFGEDMAAFARTGKMP
jgi:hypothetical protein